MSFSEFARTLTNVEIAKSLEYDAPRAPSDHARAVMIEAAKRLRLEPPVTADLPAGPLDTLRAEAPLVAA